MDVLFVCKYNSGRSQMAKGFFKALSKKHHAESAGTNAVERADKPIPEYVINCMNAAGIDVSKHQRKQLTPEMIEDVDKIIMITAKKDWPDYVKKSKKVLFWGVEDAKGQSYEFHCKIRDEIKGLVQKLVKDLE